MAALQWLMQTSMDSTMTAKMAAAAKAREAAVPVTSGPAQARRAAALVRMWFATVAMRAMEKELTAVKQVTAHALAGSPMVETTVAQVAITERVAAEAKRESQVE